MRTKEFTRNLNGNRTVRSIHYYTDSGLELAYFKDDGKGEPYSKVLYFNAALMAVPCYDPKSTCMTCAQRAKHKYMEYFYEIEKKHQGIAQSEFCNY